MDISGTLAPKSEQMDAIDLAGGERTFTVTKAVVNKGADQPVTLTLAEFDRPWKPNLTMRRLLALGWGVDSSQYVGRRVTLYREGSVMWAGKKVGGIRIKAMSHMDKPLLQTLPVNQNQYETFNIQPLKEAPRGPSQAEWLARLEGVRADVDGLLQLKADAEAANLPQAFIDQINDAGMALSKEAG